MMKSIWQEEVQLEKREPLRGEHHTRVAIIGGGMAGILTAYLLKEAGVATVILEADRIGGGQSGKTTAKITSQHGMIYQYLTETFGREKALNYATLNQQAIQEYERIISKNKIDCNFARGSAYLYAMEGDGSEKRIEALQAEIKAAADLGIEAAFTKETELPFPIAGAEVFYNQASFHPLKFIAAISKELEIYERSRVLKTEENCAITQDGLMEADHIVFASHYPYLITPGYYFLRMHQERSYVLALEGVEPLKGMYKDMDEHGLSFRSTKGALLLGGAGHRTGENIEGGKYASLRTQADILYPSAKEVAHWSAQDCISIDRVPYIGYLSGAIPNWHVATGFGKWGMTNAMSSALILRDMILGQEHEQEEIFLPQRFHLSASAKSLTDNGMQAMKGLTKQAISFPVESAQGILPGSGGVVEFEGKKAGVYKDLEGNVFAVSVKCPHLGCQLTWNQDELSWDCPCHGSRFDYQGNLLDDPAQEGIGI